MLARDQLARFATHWRVWDAAVTANRAYEGGAPAAYRAWLNRGTAALREGRGEDALADYTHAAGLAPDLPEIQINRAAALQQLGRATAALEALDAGLALGAALPDRARARAHANRAAILLGLGRGREAVADLETAAKLDPSVPEYGSNATRLRAMLPP
jgi:tetratricopeptide (TPR) repeat protein